MKFETNQNVEDAFKASIHASIAERKAAICDTWDPEKVMALPWGVKGEVSADMADDVEKYFESIQGQKVDCGDNVTVEVLKAGVKERKGKHTLIYRYVISQS